MINIDWTKGVWDSGKYKHLYSDGFWNAIIEEHYPEEYAEMMSYLAEHPEALVPEPVPPPPTPEALAQQTIATNQAILTATDWHFAYSAETGDPVLQSVIDQRKAARAAITAAKAVLAKN